MLCLSGGTAAGQGRCRITARNIGEWVGCFRRSLEWLFLSESVSSGKMEMVWFSYSAFGRMNLGFEVGAGGRIGDFLVLRKCELLSFIRWWWETTGEKEWGQGPQTSLVLALVWA